MLKRPTSCLSTPANSGLFECNERKSVLQVDVPTPLSQSVDDFCGRLVSIHDIPAFTVPGLRTKLRSHVDQAEKDAACSRADDALMKLKDMNTQTFSHAFSQLYCQEVRCYAQCEEMIIDLTFAELYRKLIHSSSLTTILNVEHSYAMAMQRLVHERDKTLLELERRQANEMSRALSGGGPTDPIYTDEQINRLAQRHFECLELETVHWESKMSKLREDQKREYHDWLRNINEDPTQSALRVRALSDDPSFAEDECLDEPKVRLEESFTIHLGAQLKTTHNMRIMRCHVLDLCRHAVHIQRGRAVPEPLRLQTALSLYSNNLSGLILLVDDRLSTYTGIKKQFSNICLQSTDFHFPDLQQQLDEVEVTGSSEMKQAHIAAEGSSLKSVSSDASMDSQERKSRLRTGSFYVTKHSNLAEVHTVFHLVADDSLLGDITSRHAVILGLRNVLKACFRHDVMTLTIPLLLAHEMTEEMTIAWCLKRAELVFKCVKGFMMEMSTWATAESRTIQFLIPESLSEDTFYTLSNMLPGIFRQSSPIMGS